MNCPSCKSEHTTVSYYDSLIMYCRKCDCEWEIKRVLVKVLKDPRHTTTKQARAIPAGQVCPFEFDCFHDKDGHPRDIVPANRILWTMYKNCPTKDNIKEEQSVKQLWPPTEFKCAVYTKRMKTMAG